MNVIKQQIGKQFSLKCHTIVVILFNLSSACACILHVIAINLFGINNKANVTFRFQARNTPHCLNGMVMVIYIVTTPLSLYTNSEAFKSKRGNQNRCPLAKSSRQDMRTFQGDGYGEKALWNECEFFFFFILREVLHHCNQRDLIKIEKVYGLPYRFWRIV